MKPLLCICGILLGFSFLLFPVEAGSLSFFDNRPEVHGKLTLNATSIHVDGSSASDINLADVIEADFDDADFHLDYFSSDESPSALPANWHGADIGAPDVPGSSSYANGTLTINVGQGDVFADHDKCFFLARPWANEDGQWTAHVKERSDDFYAIGLMVRMGLAPDAISFTYGAMPDNGAFLSGRATVGTVPGRDTRFIAATPGWLRLTCYQGWLMDMESSADGKAWEMTDQDGLLPGGTKVLVPPFLSGIFAYGKTPKVAGKVVLDHVTFAPPPAQPEAIRPGVLLRSGSFLSGSFNVLSATEGNFNRNGKNFAVTIAQTGVVMWQPMTLRELAQMGQQHGVIMKNGDFLTADFQNLSGAGVNVNSVELGPLSYIYEHTLRACVLHPLQPKPSAYEIRLKDGSYIRASGLDVTNGQIIIHEISGVNVPADPGEIAQFRAGASRVQSLIELPWKATTAPFAKSLPAGVQITPVQCWEGKNREQIMAVGSGTVIDFPLTGKLHAVAMRVALLSEVPNEQTVIHVLVDGKEIGRTPPIKATDQPCSIQVQLQGAQSISFSADGVSPMTKVLYLDPVATRD